MLHEKGVGGARFSANGARYIPPRRVPFRVHRSLSRFRISFSDSRGEFAGETERDRRRHRDAAPRRRPRGVRGPGVNHRVVVDLPFGIRPGPHRPAIPSIRGRISRGPGKFRPRLDARTVPVRSSGRRSTWRLRGFERNARRDATFSPQHWHARGF